MLLYFASINTHLSCSFCCLIVYHYVVFPSAIDLADEAEGKLKMEITSRPTELDEIDRAMLKLEMEKLL